MDVLQWARDNGCPWDEKTCAAAASTGHLDVLRWARDNRCPWDEKTCEGAGRWGHLDVLQWARDNGCPWNEQNELTCESDELHELLEKMRWAMEHV